AAGAGRARALGELPRLHGVVAHEVVFARAAIVDTRREVEDRRAGPGQRCGRPLPFGPAHRKGPRTGPQPRDERPAHEAAGAGHDDGLIHVASPKTKRAPLSRCPSWWSREALWAGCRHRHVDLDDLRAVG